MEIIKIVRRERNLLETLMLIWEDSVRHTHDFLRESDIKALRPLVYQNLESIPELWAIKAGDSCYKGFMGIDGIKLEMLFVASSERGQGFGSKLLRHAVSGLGVTEVDVNEQNPQAYCFYQKQGFKKYSRSELDGQGNPFPVLHLRYISAKDGYKYKEGR